MTFINHKSITYILSYSIFYWKNGRLAACYVDGIQCIQHICGYVIDNFTNKDIWCYLFFLKCIHLYTCANKKKTFSIFRKPNSCLFFYTILRYDPEGHLTNATFPTGEVSSFYSDMEKSTRVELDTSNKENVFTTTNISATSIVYALKQGSVGDMTKQVNVNKKKGYRYS